MKKMFDVAISSSSSLKLCHMHACNGAERGKLEEGSGQWHVGSGQSILNMVQSGVIFMPCTDGPQLSKGFLHLRTQYVNTVYCILLYNTVYFFLVCRLKTNHVKE
jgi:hypothetical protein